LGNEVVVVAVVVGTVVAVIAIANLVLVFYDIFLQNTLLLRRTGNTANVQGRNVYIEHLPYHLPIDN
jgi:cbb3-type cytochrome oxidase cytochrome c subunit